MKLSSLYNKPVYFQDKEKYLGRIRDFYFRENKFCGVEIKRTDFLLLFRRKNVYLPVESLDFDDQILIKHTKNEAKNKWKNQLAKQKQGRFFTLLSKKIVCNKESIGVVTDIETSDVETNSNQIVKLYLADSFIAEKLLGEKYILWESIVDVNEEQNSVVVKENVSVRESSEGLSQKAGKATSIAIDKTKKVGKSSIDKMQESSDNLKGMFKDFANEIKKGMQDEED